MQLPNEEEIEEIVNAIDEILSNYMHLGAHNLTGVLLSRVVLLMHHEPSVGKDLVRYVWERLDQIEQDGPGDLL